MVKEPFNYKRTITHTQYRHGDKEVKKGGLKGRLHTIISKDRFVLNEELKEKDYCIHADANFWAKPVHGSVYIDLLWGGGLFSLFFLSFLATYITSDEESVLAVLFILLSFLGVVFFVYYYYTAPYKEFICNRKDGLLTYPGFMWQKNVTMPINRVIFAMSGPSVQGTGAFELIIARPDRFYSKYLASMNNNCYEDLSFYLWYMDKNRPLPPGTAFDPYREEDFERRKSEGFPKPLFPSSIPTPEATPEQQAERLMIGGW